MEPKLSSGYEIEDRQTDRVITIGHLNIPGTRQLGNYNQIKILHFYFNTNLFAEYYPVAT
jgi:hypothetical protein